MVRIEPFWEMVKRWEVARHLQETLLKFFAIFKMAKKWVQLTRFWTPEALDKRALLTQARLGIRIVAKRLLVLPLLVHSD